MTRVTVDPTTAAQLNTISDREVALCDADGNVIGWYTPVRPKPTIQEVIESCPFSDEEIQRQLDEETGTGRTWAEIRKDLEAR